MTSRIFQGGTADWYLPASWSPSGTPQPGDVLTVGTGNATISAADVITFGSLDNESLLIGSGSSASPAVFSADGASFGTGFTISSAGAGFATLDFTGSVNFAGAIQADTAGGVLAINIAPDATAAGTLALEGILSVGNGDSVFINGGTVLATGEITVTDGVLSFASGTTLQGGGTIDIGAGGTVTIEGPVAPGVVINFLDDTGTLNLADPLEFNGTVTGFVKGDVIDLVDAPSYDWFYGPNKQLLSVYGSNSREYSNPDVATFVLTSNTALTTQQIFVGQDGNGGSLIQLVDIRTWNSATSGAWYSSGNWTTAGSLSANSYPLFGDTAIINSGTATITASDFVNFGPLNNENVQLSGTGAGLVAVEGTLGTRLSILSAAPQTTTSLTFAGITTSDARIDVTGENSTLQIAVVDDGAVAGDFVNSLTGTILVSTESSLDVVSGRVTNDGQIIIRGAATIEAGATIDGSGVIELNDVGITLTVAGSIGPNQQVSFYYNNLAIAPGAEFNGIIEDFTNGATIDLQGVAADFANYDPTSNILTLRDGGASGSIVASLNIAGSYGATDFVVASDGNGGSFITDTAMPSVQSAFSVLPAPVVAEAGQTVSLIELLNNAFGTDFLATVPELQLWSPSQADLDSFSYWDPNAPRLPYWTVNGTPVTPDNYQSVLPQDIGSIQYVAGNLIWAAAQIQLPTAFAGGDPTYLIDYQLQTFGSAFAQPSLQSGAPTPQDIVNAASAFAAAYTNVPNTEDCWNIAREVAAAAGAGMVSQTYSTTPQDNVAGGFWRIEYAAPQDGSAIANWSTLVEAGDILRIGWASGGPHSFTIIDPLDQSGSITVFNNIYYTSPTSFEAIGIHQAQYWTSTDPNDITIYRLDPNNFYLVDYVTTNGGLVQNLTGAIVQGTTFNDLLLPAGTGALITGGGGLDVIADTSAILNGATVTDFGLGDMFGFTDLDSATMSLLYDPGTGLLNVMSSGSAVATLQLPDNLAGQFEITNLGGTAGLDGGTLGGLYQTLFPNAAVSGGAVTLVTCFAAGTAIATQNGVVAVEHLAIGDLIRCADGGTQPVAWIGHRHVDISRHPQPDRVLPIHIAPNAFGDRQPSRPLLLSPDHAVFADGVLIPIRYLVNGSTVAQVAASAMDAVTYYHVELPRHDLMVAEGLAVESYLDTGNRDLFCNGGGPVVLFPDFSTRIWEAEGCAPLRIVGAEVEAVRARLRHRAALLPRGGSVKAPKRALGR